MKVSDIMAGATDMVEALVSEGSIAQGTVNYIASKRRIEINLVPQESMELVEINILIGDQDDTTSKEH